MIFFGIIIYSFLHRFDRITDPARASHNNSRHANLIILDLWWPKHGILIGLLIVALVIITALASIIGVYCGINHCGNSRHNGGKSTVSSSADNGTNPPTRSSSNPLYTPYPVTFTIQFPTTLTPSRRTYPSVFQQVHDS